MAKKPDAARGKTTRIGRIKKIAKGIKERAKSNTGMNMSPGAMGGRTKMKSPQQPIRGMKPALGARKAFGQAGRSMIRGAGASGAAMSGQAMKLAKKLKTSGRLSVADIKRAKEMMKNRKGK